MLTYTATGLTSGFGPQHSGRKPILLHRSNGVLIDWAATAGQGVSSAFSRGPLLRRTQNPENGQFA
jgi:hypothetical protein